MTAGERAALARAKARLDTLDWWPRPSARHVRLATVPWMFRLPWFRRFAGYAMWNLVLLRRPVSEHTTTWSRTSSAHVWQMQHRPLRMPLSYLVRGYRDNPYEREAPGRRGHRSRSASAAREKLSPGRTPPSSTRTRPPTATAPSPWRGVGRSGSAVHRRRPGSSASTSAIVPAASSPPTTTIREPMAAAAMPPRGLRIGGRRSHRPREGT